MITLNIFDYALSITYILIILFIAKIIQKKNIDKFPEFRYFTLGLFAKLIGGIGVVFIYIYYYNGGDTTLYFHISKGMVTLAGKDFNGFLSILGGNLTLENYWTYRNNVYDTAYFGDPQSFFVIRITSLFAFLGLKSFLVTTILVATFTYFGIWKLFRLFISIFPERTPSIAFSILFVPSVFFWGSGILKDSYTLFALCIFIVSSFNLLFKADKFKNLLGIVFASYILLSIKPYIFFAAFIALLIMIIYNFYHKSKSTTIKYFILPIISLSLIIGGSTLMFSFGSGAYSSFDKLMEKAIVTQNDLKQEYYSDNSFDIGTIDPTLWGFISKAPAAIAAGLFRPYIWESRNIVMIISGLENLIILFLFTYSLILSLVIILKSGFKIVFKVLFSHSLLVYAIVFAFIFAFSVGLTTSNFGALVRYKIPAIPLFLSALFIITYKLNREVSTLNKKRTFIAEGF